jgi:hypothetical protein
VKAVALLNQILTEGEAAGEVAGGTGAGAARLPMQMLLDCELVDGTTLGAPAR